MYRSQYNRFITKNSLQSTSPKTDSLLYLLSKKNKYSGNCFNENEKMHALSLWHSSPKCYSILYKTLTLSSISTLRHTLNAIKLMPGFQEMIFNALHDKCKDLDIKDKIVLIAFDEISLKSDLKYNKKYFRWIT